MKQHWREKHGWATQTQAGQMNCAHEKAAQAELEQACWPVTCQQVFLSGFGSHYIAVQADNYGKRDHGHSRQEPIPPEDAVQRCIEQLQMCWQEEQQAQATAPVEPGNWDEANPWLRCTGWAVYLARANVPSAVASMRTPIAMEDAEEMAQHV